MTPGVVRLHRMVPRVQLLAVSLITLFFGTVFSNGVSYVNASVDYDQGYALGCANAKLSDPNIKKPEKPEDRSFLGGYNAGYYDGFTECSETRSAESRAEGSQSFEEAPQPTPQQGGIDWIETCNDLQMALVSSCEVLVNPDNTLTSEGERAVGCIRNGIALAGGGSLLLSLPLPLVIAALQFLEEPTGCGGIVEWGLIGNVGDLRGIINRLT